MKAKTTKSIKAAAPSSKSSPLGKGQGKTQVKKKINGKKGKKKKAGSRSGSRSQSAYQALQNAGGYSGDYRGVVKDPEIRAFAYQVIAELSPYLTPTSRVRVEFLNPERWVQEDLFRVALVLSDFESEVSQEASAPDLFEAILKAKNRLLSVLQELQESILNAQERQLQILSLLGSGGNSFIH